MQKSLLILISSFIFSLLSYGQDQASTQIQNLSKLPSQAELQKSILWNQIQSEKFQKSLAERGIRDTYEASPVAKPYVDYQRAGYLLFSLQDGRTSYNAKKIMAEHLPDDTKLAVFKLGSAQLTYTEQEKINIYRQLVGEDRFLFLHLEKEVIAGRTSLWARDFLPLPMRLKKPIQSKDLGFTDAQYYHYADSATSIGKLFESKVLKHAFKFEGGNFQADNRGNCFIVNYGTGTTITNDVLKYFYGCLKVFKLPYKGGIGHVDERIRIVSDQIVFTDTPDYVSIFENLGYKVELLPRADYRYQTYANSLYVNGTLFMPTFQNTEKNNLAYEVYKKHIPQVIPIDSTQLSQLKGSLHCISMTYPKVNHAQLLRRLEQKPKIY